MKKTYQDTIFFNPNKRCNITVIFLLLLFLVINLNMLNFSAWGQEISEEDISYEIPIYIADFFEPGCHDCEKTARLLEQIAFQYPKVEIRKFDISTPEGVALAEQLGEIYRVPEHDRLLVPLIYIGDSFLLREQINYDNIVNLIEQIKGEEPPPWEKTEEDPTSVQQRLIERFQSFGIGAIAVSGLIDGINPCAFATIIFFISYLALIKRTGKELLLVGSMFTLAIFLTYFLIGAGALRVVTTLSFLPLARLIFIFVTAGIGIILGTLSLLDYLKYKRTGQTGDSTLQLPPRIKQMIHSTIRKNVKTHNFVIMAAITGFLVSILELACTGQIYLPTLIFISNVPELRANALIYLLIYNFMFVVPLILVFLFTYWGTSSQKWAELNKRHFGTVKIIMTVLFFGLAILLIITGLLF
jgi:thiol-disulfide isomerase/thioredoxin